MSKLGGGFHGLVCMQVEQAKIPHGVFLSHQLPSCGFNHEKEIVSLFSFYLQRYIRLAYLETVSGIFKSTQLWPNFSLIELNGSFTDDFRGSRFLVAFENPFHRGCRYFLVIPAELLVLSGFLHILFSGGRLHCLYDRE